MYRVTIVDRHGLEFDPGEAPEFESYEEACDAACELALTLAEYGRVGEQIIVRNLVTGEVESVFTALDDVLSAS